ncbi:protein of unknown function [Chryseobacterium sp. JV274]|nr:protein of unknown function [Chryseobacterium sp. JV274]
MKLPIKILNKIINDIKGLNANAFGPLSFKLHLVYLYDKSLCNILKLFI